MDLGASYHRSMGILDEMASWTIGFQAANLGSKLDGQKLPARLGLGGAIDLPFSMDNRLQVALDFNYLLPSEYRHLQAGIGAEYNFLKYGIIRGGYHFGITTKEQAITVHWAAESTSGRFARISLMHWLIKTVSCIRHGSSALESFSRLFLRAVR